MLVLIHVTIALSSIILASFTLLKPSQSKLRASYGLVAATFVSGTYLVVSQHLGLVSACQAGLTYLAFVTVSLAAAHHRLAGHKK